MSRFRLLAAAAVLAAGSAQAQPRLELGSERTATLDAPLPQQPGVTIASEITGADQAAGGWWAEHFLFTGKAGDVLTLHANSDIPMLSLMVLHRSDSGKYSPAFRGPANKSVQVVLKKDGTHVLIIGAAKQSGRYELGFQSSAVPVAAKAMPAAQVRRVDIAAQLTGPTRPAPVQTGQLIAGEIAPGDYLAGPDWNGDVLVLNARAGEVVTAQLKSEIPGVELHIHPLKSHTGRALIEGPATAAPLRFLPPKDAAYLIFVHAKGPARFGPYLLSLGSNEGAPSFDPPKPAPAQVAEARPSSAPSTSPALPATPGVLNVAAGQTLARPAGKAGPGVETFQFLAGAGADLSAKIVAQGRVSATLYTPQGETIRTIDGTGSATLDAVLPLDGLYFLAVSRENAAKPYTLALTATQPDPITAAMRLGVGYERLNDKGQVTSWSCWLQPKVRARHVNLAAGGGITTQTNLSDGRMRWDGASGSGYAITWTGRVEGDAVVMLTDNGVVANRINFTLKPGRYRGYLCP